MTVVAGKWFVNLSPAYTQGVRLLCIPNAGGSPALFRAWASALPAAVGVTAVVLPGQGARVYEQPPTDVRALAEDLCQAFGPLLNEPFALFGYSMGALIAFEVSRALLRQGLPLPLHLFVAARRAPHVADTLPPIHALPDADFVQAVQARYGGIPESILQDRELMALFTPVLRANFEMIETYRCAAAPPLGLPITAFGGAHDRTTSAAELRTWGSQTSGAFAAYIFEGGHFFIQQHEAAVLALVARGLKPFLHESQWT